MIELKDIKLIVDLVKDALSIKTFISKYPSTAYIEDVSAVSRRKLAEFTIYAGKPFHDGIQEYDFSAFSSVAFSLSHGRPLNVFTLYSKHDVPVSSEDIPEDVIIKKMKQRSVTGNKYVYEFDKEYIYQSENENKTKPFLVFIETNKKLHMCYVIMQQKPQAISQANEKSIVTQFDSHPEFNARSCVAYKESEQEKIKNDYSSDEEILDTVQIANAIKSAVNLHHVK